MAFAFLYVAPFIGVASVKELQDKGLLNVIQRWEGQIREPEILKRCQRLFSQERAEFRSELLPADMEEVRAGNLPLQEHPLFRFENGSAFPISLPLLLEKGTMGLYWMLHKLFSQNDPKEGVRTFTAFVGQLFLEYATDLFKRISIAITLAKVSSFMMSRPSSRLQSALASASTLLPMALF